MEREIAEKIKLQNILGVKCLAWNDKVHKLVSPSVNGFVWEPNQPHMASCPNGHEDIPYIRCYCGIHATWQADIAKRYTNKSYISPWCLLEAGGKIMYHKWGWRAAEARIVMVAFDDATTDHQMTRAGRQTADIYGIDLISLTEMLKVMDIYNYVYIQELNMKRLAKGENPIVYHPAREENVSFAKGE